MDACLTRMEYDREMRVLYIYGKNKEGEEFIARFTLSYVAPFAGVIKAIEFEEVMTRELSIPAQE